MIKKYRIVEAKVRPSDLYWSVSMLLSFMLVILYYVRDKKIYIGVLAIIMFIGGLFISHNKKIEHSLNYHKEEIK